MHKNATKCNKTQSKWCINKHGSSKTIDTLETYHGPILIDNPPCLEVVTTLCEHKDDIFAVCNGTLTHESPTLFLISPNYTLEEKFAYVEKYLCDLQLSLVPNPRYNQEAMIPPKLGDVWIPKVLVTIGK
jgi:hypothetical protein